MVASHKLVGILALVLALALGAGVRISQTLGDPHFDGASARGFLRTDPALLLYFTGRIVEAGGLPPDDFGTDRRVEYPEASDVPAMFTVGQEFVVAWVQLLLGDGTPLHVRAVWVMSICAALTALGAFGLTLELTRRWGWAGFAAVLFALVPANYRTLGFVLIREDFSFPFFALHLWLAARAVRVGSAASVVGAGLALVAAAATWHATGFLLLIEAACVALVFLRSARNPMGARRAWLLPAVVVLGSLAVPVLRAKQFPLSVPMLVVWALWIAALLRPRLPRERTVFLGALAALVALSLGVSAATGGGLSDYGHVFGLIAGKLRNLGRLPADPSELSFGARLLWQGPFATAPPELFELGLPLAVLAIGAAAVLRAPRAWRGGGDERELALVLVGLVGLLATWLIVRVQILPGLVAPVLAAVVLAPLRPVLGRGLAALALVASAGLMQATVLSHDVAWYSWPGPQRIVEQRRLMDWIEAEIPAGEPIAADFQTSAAILAFTGHPILQQPKYETGRSRERIEQFFRAFFLGTPQELHATVRRLDTRYLVLDRPWLTGNLYIAGLPASPASIRPGTAAAAFLSTLLTGRAVDVPGFRLLYESPPELRFRSYAVYQLE